jgi:HEAT repeats
MDGASDGGKTIVDPEEFLRSALEKIVFFECRVSQLESELAAARTTAERARGDAAQARQRETEVRQALTAERGARADAEARQEELAERVRLLEGERERLLGGLVQRARLSGAPTSDGAPGPEEGGADLAGFIAELRAEIETLRAWKAAAEAREAEARVRAALEVRPHSSPGGVEPEGAAADGAVAGVEPARSEAAEATPELAPAGAADGAGPSAEEPRSAPVEPETVVEAEPPRSEPVREPPRPVEARPVAVRPVAVRPVREPLKQSVAESVAQVAARFATDGRVGFTYRDSEQMKALLATRADRALYERSMDDLSCTDPGKRLRAVRALEALGTNAAAPLLAVALGREGDAEVKAALLGAVARFREPFAIEVAARALEDARPAVRIAALEAIAEVAGARAEERLSASLSDPSPLVRRRAALLLGFVAGERAEAALAVALTDEDRGVARAAAAALSGRPTCRAQGALARGLEHPDASVRRATATALGRIAGETVNVDAPTHTRRAASRRIAEKLATMGRDEIRAAVLDAAAGPRTVAAATATATATATPTATATAPPTPTATATATAPVRKPARAEPVEARAGVTAMTPAAPRAAHRPTRTAVAVLDPEPPSELASGILGEIRAALRGCTAQELATALASPQPSVNAALAALGARGTLVRRGARWFMS